MNALTLTLKHTLTLSLSVAFGHNQSPKGFRLALHNVERGRERPGSDPRCGARP